MTGRIVAALAVEAVVLGTCLVVVADLAAHRRVERVGGVNIWNYRGPVAHQRQPREIRVAVVGGTRAFSWGVAASETLPASVGGMIRLATDRPGEPLRPIVAINLGQLGALPASYAQTIDHFAYLAPDYICLYDDLGVAGATTADRASFVRDWTGYMPALPLVMREKGALWRGSDAASRRAIGRAMVAAGSLAAAIDRRLAGSVEAASGPSRPGEDALAYADGMMAAIDAAHRHARGVVVAFATLDTAAQVRNWRAVHGRLAERRDSLAWLRTVDLSDVTELYDDALRLDGWNFGAAGNAIAAAAIAPALLDLIERIPASGDR